MLNNIAICATYFLEMLIAYIFFSQIGEKKYNLWICCLIGTAVFEIGAISDIVFSNTIWINAIMFIIINFLFAFFCFNIKTTKILFYSVILDIFSTALEFAAIFLISTITNTEVTAYVDNITFFIIDVSVSKLLYFITCLILSALVKKEKRNVKIPIALYFYPAVIIFALIIFWSICANYDLSNTHQVLLSVVSAAMFLATVILFIVYQDNVAKENQYLIIEQEIEKTNIDKKFYDILEQQNSELMIYAHDTKNHLNAIKALNTNEQIDKYLTKMTDELKAHSSTCHSGNHTLDVLVNKCVTECEIKHIRFDFDLRLSNLKIVDDYDLVTILGNILDNAVESASKAENKYISLTTNKVNTYDSIMIINSCDTPPKSVERELKTTKKDKKSHGLGIKSVMKILKKYKGDLEWEYDSEKRQFTTTIILK
ncbi:MAG: GHKL domain-containing protein [Acetobacter sp.]|nr:GHKL domain-containing protein [Bacteroides sp.]MCM1340960.1 GHKL domain-containing protein [Acetobacter sp.]MCM1432484.1 GHKL domain-containing protein [Clostridiales bacterium]